MTAKQLNNHQKRIYDLRSIITQFVHSREQFYNKRGHKRTNEMEAISTINRYMDIRKGTGLATHMKMVLLREDDFNTIMPHSMEDPENMGKANLMKKAIQQCRAELHYLQSQSQQLKIAS